MVTTMSELILYGLGEKTLSVDRGCLLLELNKINTQMRIIPIAHVLCVEVSAPQENHRGYIYFRTPVANKPIKSSVVGRDVNADDDMIFFDGDDNYQVAVKIQEYIADYYSRP
jgi:hypothetical protein